MADRAGRVLSRGAAHLVAQQRTGGEWEGEVVWCTMILSQYVFVRSITGSRFTDDERAGILRHYTVTRTAEGGWPLHPEGPPLVFTTALAYVALRLLGEGAEDALPRAAREWLRRQPAGVLGIPTWGKFWLSLLGLYGKNGVAAFPPELFLLPATPGHPDTWYCHTRYIYLGMSYLSARGFTANLGPLRDQLRRELYAEAYDTIDFAAHIDHVAASDLFAKPASALGFARGLLPLVRAIPTRTHERAMESAFERIVNEQRTTRYQALSPVNGLLNCLAIYATDPLHADLQPSLAGLEAWRWVDDTSGIRYAGARSQSWDTAFAARALASLPPVAQGFSPASVSPVAQGFSPASVPPVAQGFSPASVSPAPVSPASVSSGVRAALRAAHGYLTRGQITGDLPAGHNADRDPIRGGWCFSDGAHRWPVSDCTAEALSAVLAIERVADVIPAVERLPRDRVQQALGFIRARQNPDGGFSTYERQRAGTWLDRLNPSEMFRDCMTERSYVECTASAIEAIAVVHRVYPDSVTADDAASLERGIAFLRGRQERDGTFPASWGINKTYAIFHVAKALRAAGISGMDPALAQAAAWLRSTQRPDGGWGEHFSGSLENCYVEHPCSQVVMTSWALLALGEINLAHESIHRGVEWLVSRQQPDGSWPREAVNGVFFGTAMLDYAMYVSYFPVWALARCAGLRA